MEDIYYIGELNSIKLKVLSQEVLSVIQRAKKNGHFKLDEKDYEFQLLSDFAAREKIYSPKDDWVLFIKYLEDVFHIHSDNPEVPSETKDDVMDSIGGLMGFVSFIDDDQNDLRSEVIAKTEFELDPAIEKIYSRLKNVEHENLNFRKFTRQVDSLLEESRSAKSDVNKFLSFIKDEDRPDESIKDLYNGAYIFLEKIERLNDIVEEKSRTAIKEIEELAAVVASKGIAGDHSNTAANEKVSANRFRLGAIALMLISTGVLAYSLFNIDPNEHIQTAYRVVISLLLTVPAAYLARESAKHRQQQHRYHEMALSVAALEPMINKLDKDDQNKIRAQLATEMLRPSTVSAQVQDPYPINPNDLVMKLLDKVDLKPSPAEKPKPAPEPEKPKEPA